MRGKKALIIGAGPAGLTAAYELLRRTKIQPQIFENDNVVGGISKTVIYKGNCLDIGGHRFFSKSDWVMNWWLNILPLQGKPACDEKNGPGRATLSNDPNAPDPDKDDMVMLARNRISRILFKEHFYPYPLQLDAQTLIQLGIKRIIKIIWSYGIRKFWPIRPEKSLQDFFTNRFGRELFSIFLKDYTEKVWGVGSEHIKPEWGAQRIKGLSISSALLHAINALFGSAGLWSQKSTETTLISQFLYPKYGPGQLWQETARQIRFKGGEINLRQKVVGIYLKNHKIYAVAVQNHKKQTRKIQVDYVISSMPIKELVQIIRPWPPVNIRKIAQGLSYRDFITIGLLVKRLKISSPEAPIRDNWIYIQEPGVKLGRLQIFNNWSPYLVKNQTRYWLGLEYFCQQDDELWRKSDREFSEMAIAELSKIKIIDSADVLDYKVIRVPKAYPGYFGTYDQIQTVKDYLDKIDNLFLVGRNGMHCYNNQDASMLTAAVAIDNIAKGITSKKNIWELNNEQAYIEAGNSSIKSKT